MYHVCLTCLSLTVCLSVCVHSVVSKGTYDALLTECRRVQQVYYHGRGGTSMVWERRMADLLAAVAEFIIARKSMTDV